MTDEKLKNALYDCATGLSSEETVKEYALEDGEMKLVKMKVTKREIPPDIKAVKMILEEDLQELSTEELEKEKENLINMLKEMQSE
ncbi:MAG: hypothetical protein K2I20_05395 [Clostridia bacterium]|nr:hypothetical protein [Clostridia bacterium]MDE6356838.1 hypothetical protein [Clostridia bacterium]